MEYLEGRTLAELLRTRIEFGFGQKIRYILDVCDGLEYVHRRSLVHRDLKPSNIFVTNENSVKILDFGIASSSDVSGVGRLTQHGVTLGSPDYLSPEQIRGAAPDPRSDIWALGVTLYELMSSRLPFEADSDFELQVRITREPPAPITSVNSPIPKSIESIIAKMLSKNADDRFQSVAEVRLELQAAYRKLSDKTEIVFPHVFVHDLRPKRPGTVPERPIQERSASAQNSAPATPTSRSKSVGVTKLVGMPAPNGFFEATVISKTSYFQGDDARYDKIEQSLKFYRDNLSEEYRSLSDQARITYYLWILSVVLGLAALVSGIILLFMKQFASGSITTISTTFVYFIQRVFQQREDHYRSLAAAKHQHLEYGNHWLLVIQSIDAIRNQREKERRQSELVDVLTKKLSTSSTRRSRAIGSKKPR